ncbi:HAD hydrolase-like protein [Candidatus Woesearchaeota archaeon]|nr:HAD hydrolase-like protein [Candidatus Woesearchaeota archaeon]
MIRAIIFDLDGVYFDKGSDDFYINISEKFNVPLEKAKEAFFGEEMKRHKRGETSKEEYWGWFIKELCIDTTPEKLIEMMRKMYHADDKIRDLVKDVRRKGFETIVCSNNFQERVDFLRDDFDLGSVFDHIYFSCEQGMLKPGLIDVMLNETGFRPEEILLIDDMEYNFKGLDEKGIKYMLYQDFSQLTEYLKEISIL